MTPTGQFRVQFLGTGNTWCDAGRANQAILVGTEGQTLLVDCGPNTLLQAKRLGADLTGLDAIFLTHLHADHTFGLPTLLLEMNFFHRRQRPLTIYAPPGSAGYADRLLEMAYPDVFLQGLEYAYETVALEPGDRVDLGDCAVEVFEMDHSITANGYRFRSGDRAIAISGDTVPCVGLVEMSQGTDLLITECSYPEHLPGVAHTSLTALRTVAPELGAQRIVVVHTDGVSDVSPFEQPGDGDVITI